MAKNAARRKKARIPEEISFKTKPQIALEQIAKALAAWYRAGGAHRCELRIELRVSHESQCAGLEYVAAIIPTIRRRVTDDSWMVPRTA